MAKISDVTQAHTSGFTHIDALLNTGPAWNYLLPATNTLLYTFNITSNVETPGVALQAFSSAQQAATRAQLAYISSLTGIQFSETPDGNAQLHFAMKDINGDSTSGLCSWSTSYNFEGDNNLTTYSAEAYVYLDNVEWSVQNNNLSAGGQGYETLLHEMGHALGLKHSFDGTIRLPQNEDNTSFTLMSYTEQGGPYSTYSQYDLAALAWLYGGDGLAGTRGLNSSGGRYLIGSAATETLNTSSGDDVINGRGGNDVFEGRGGNDSLIAGNGFDTALYAAARANFSISKTGDTVSVTDNTGALGIDSLQGIERIKFNDSGVAFDIDGIAGKAYRIYQAAFDRIPDLGGLGFWIKAMDSGVSLKQVAQGFVASAEFTSLYGSNPSMESVVTKLYNNVLHRAPEQGGYDFWVNALKQGVPLADVLSSFSESPENQAQVIGRISAGIEFNLVA